MLTNTERQQIVEEVNAGTYGIDEALDDIAAAQKGEEVRKALYAEALVLNREGHAGSTDMIARQQIANLQTSVNGQISTLRTEVGDDIDDLETALNSGLATQDGKIAAQNATIANVVANYNVEYGSTELWASTGETGALAAGTTVTLSEDVSHFDYIDIYSFCGNSNVLDTVPVDAKLQSSQGYALRWVNLSDPGSGSYKAYVRIIETRLHIIGTTLTIDHQVTYRNGEEVNISGAEITSSNRSTYVGELGIMKVVGRKITANTEVTDMRIGADGTEYASAGQAVRAQVTALESAIPAVDSTLSTQGAAADAKVTGDAVVDLKSAVVNKDGINEVTPQNLQIVDAVISKNLYDPESVSQGYMKKDGSIEDTNYSHTDYIPVVAGDYYYFSQYMSGNQIAMSVHNVCCFDSNKNVLPDLGTDVAFEGLYLVPDGVSFIRSSNYKNNAFSKWQIEHNNEMTEYEPYGLLSAVIKDEYIPPIDMADVPVFELVQGQNLWDRNDPDYQIGFLNVNGSVDSNNTSYRTSGFISVKQGNRLVGSYRSGNGYTGLAVLRTVAAYNDAKTAINNKGVYSKAEYIVPEGIAYVRICVAYGSYGNDIQVQSLPADQTYYPYKDYEAPHYELKPDYMFPAPSAPKHVYLPPEIYVAVGRTIELYNEQIVLDHEKYHFRWVCSKGAAYKRKFSITGTTTGNYYLDLYLYDDNMNLCWKSSSVIHVVAASNPVKKILPIGDSLTNWKAWLPETMLLSSNNITFVGTRYSGQSTDSEGNIYQSGTIHSEGRSGWAASSYLANTEYTFDNRYDGVQTVPGTANPFWDGAKFSLNHYLTTQTGVPTPDAVQIFLGTNDLTDSVESAAENIIAMVESIRGEYADLPIFVCNTIYRSNQNGYGSTGNDAYAGGSGAGAWQYAQDVRVMDLMVALREGLKTYTGVYLIPLASCMDREYDFGQVMTKVNPRSTVEVPMPAESVHPQAVGYYQMADLMYSFYCGILN